MANLSPEAATPPTRTAITHTTQAQSYCKPKTKAITKVIVTTNQGNSAVLQMVDSINEHEFIEAAGFQFFWTSTKTTAQFGLLGFDLER